METQIVITIDKKINGMVKALREAESAIGKVDYTLTEKQKKGR